VAPEERRIVHCRLFFDEGNDHKALARRIFGSIRVAPREGMNEWAVFGLRFVVPHDWRLEQSSLRTGSLQFLFKAGSEELEVVRQSLARMTLGKSSLEQWLQATFAKPLKGFRCASKACDYRGHPAARRGGELSLRARPLAVFRRRCYATALAWHCPEADKLFAVRCQSTRLDDPRAGHCADSIACH
jgi:hypothetical protein